jgi:hypothetical protein
MNNVGMQSCIIISIGRWMAKYTYGSQKITSISIYHSNFAVLKAHFYRHIEYSKQLLLLHCKGDFIQIIYFGNSLW